MAKFQPKLPPKPQAQPDAEWHMPEVHPGEFVMWSPDGSETAMTPAVVMKANPKSIDVYVFGRPRPTEASRHIDDPRVRKNPDQIIEFGVWRLSDAGRRLENLEAIVTDLAARVAVLEK